jgi:hypothetical protein
MIRKTAQRFPVRAKPWNEPSKPFDASAGEAGSENTMR